MKKKKTTQQAKNLLHNVDRKFVMNLIESINMTSRERKILIDTEIEKKSIKELSIELNISLDYVSTLKRAAIQKVYEYAKINNLLQK